MISLEYIALSSLTLQCVDCDVISLISQEISRKKVHDLRPAVATQGDT